MNEESQKEKPQDGLALVIGGLFILALVFAAYNYFKSNRQGDVTKQAESTQVVTDQNQENKGDLNGDGAKSDNQKGSNDKGSTNNSGTSNSNGTASTWVANNYNKGDISGSSYTVKSGDTLWEIAEGLYGDGTQWTKLLEANKANIGFLPNGQQSLIVTGQTLVLP